MKTGMRSRPLHFPALALLAGLLLISYGNSFRGPFILDSRILIVADSRVHRATAENISLIFRENYWSDFSPWSGLYRPITTLSYVFNYAILGNRERPFGYHLLNFLLHVANACLVYLLALRLLGDFRKAWFTAALWGLHPICTESVTSITGRADVLAALAVLGALLVYIRSSSAKGWRKLLYLAAAAAITLAGLFSKENAVVVPGLAALYDVTYVIRSHQPRRTRDWVYGYAALGLPILTMWWVRSVVFAKTSLAVMLFLANPLVGADFLTSRMTAMKVLGEYIWLLVWPQKLSCDYSYNQIPLMDWHLARWEDWKTVIALIVILALVWVAVVSYRRSKAVFFFICFSGLTILPTANLFVLIGSIKAERFLYLPAFGFAGCLVAALYSACGRLAFRAVVASALLCAIAAASGTRTFLRNLDWQDEEKLWARAVEICPASFLTHRGLATSWLEKDPLQIDWSIGEAERALAIVEHVPARLSSSVPYDTLGDIYLSKGDMVAYKPRDGSLFAEPDSSDWYRKSLQILLRGVEIDREWSSQHRRRELARGRSPADIGLFGSANLYGDLGLAYLRLGEVPRALEAFADQRRLAPLWPRVYRNIADAYLKAGRIGEATVPLLESLALESPGGDIFSAAALYTTMDPAGCAVVSKQNQYFLNPDCPIVHRDLCAAYLDLTKVVPEAKLKSLEMQAGPTVSRSACAVEQARPK